MWRAKISDAALTPNLLDRRHGVGSISHSGPGFCHSHLDQSLSSRAVRPNHTGLLRSFLPSKRSWFRLKLWIGQIARFVRSSKLINLKCDLKFCFKTAAFQMMSPINIHLWFVVGTEESSDPAGQPRISKFDGNLSLLDAGEAPDAWHLGGSKSGRGCVTHYARIPEPLQFLATLKWWKLC